MLFLFNYNYNTTKWILGEYAKYVYVINPAVHFAYQAAQPTNMSANISVWVNRPDHISK